MTYTDLTYVSREALEAELRRRQGHSPPDPLAAALIGQLQDRLAAERTEILVAERKARDRAQRTSDLIDRLCSDGADGVAVTVSIDDPWDNSYTGPSVGSVTVTDVGVEKAVRAAERQHAQAAGKVRTDGVLGYRVVARLGDGSTFDVPDDVWLPYSEQTEESVRRHSDTDARQRRNAAGR